MTKQIVVIGGGPAGIEAARAAAMAGSEVTVVSNGPIGGRAGWHSLLPSKVWLTAADTTGLLNEATNLGVTGTMATTADAPAIVKRLAAIKERWNQQQAAELVDLGVKVMLGTAVFVNSDTIAIQNDGADDQTMTADAFIVASGSIPVFPPDMKPNGKTILAPRFASKLDKLPQSMIVVGAGATGCEFVYLFNRLGVAVTWLVDQYGVLPTFDQDVTQLLTDKLVARGVTVVEGRQAQRIDQHDNGITVVLDDGAAYSAEQAFLAIGRKPDTAVLNLAAAGVASTSDGDGYGRSQNPKIYLAGDVTGAPMIANRAMAQAWVAGCHAAGVETAVFNPATVIAAIYTEPQIAQMGQLTGEGIKVVKLPFTASMKTHLQPDRDGFVKLAYAEENGRIVGATAVGHHAADLLAPVAVAVQAQMRLPQFAALYGAHPTLSELAFAAARAGMRGKEGVLSAEC